MLPHHTLQTQSENYGRIRNHFLFVNSTPRIGRLIRNLLTCTGPVAALCSGIVPYLPIYLSTCGCYLVPCILGRRKSLMRKARHQPNERARKGGYSLFFFPSSLLFYCWRFIHYLGFLHEFSPLVLFPDTQGMVSSRYIY